MSEAVCPNSSAGEHMEEDLGEEAFSQHEALLNFFLPLSSMDASS